MSRQRFLRHCWHDGGYTMMSNPPQKDYKCCNCGRKHRLRQHPVEMPPHGPHVPQPHEIYEWDALPSDECIPVESVGGGGSAHG